MTIEKKSFISWKRGTHTSTGNSRSVHNSARDMANQLSPARECPAAPFEWSFRRVNNLYACIRYHKPVGVTRNFQMMFILDKFVRLIKNDAAERAVPISYETFKPKGDLETMTSDTIWSYLNILYDLETLVSYSGLSARYHA